MKVSQVAIDLKSLSRKELEKLLADTKKALHSAQARDRKVAKRAAERAAAEFGFSLNELSDEAPVKTVAKKKRAKRGPSPMKYANPEDTDQKWTGKGRKPNWFLNALDRGIDPAAMEI